MGDGAGGALLRRTRDSEADPTRRVPRTGDGARGPRVSSALVARTTVVDGGDGGKSSRAVSSGCCDSRGPAGAGRRQLTSSRSSTTAVSTATNSISPYGLAPWKSSRFPYCSKNALIDWTRFCKRWEQSEDKFVGRKRLAEALCTISVMVAFWVHLHDHHHDAGKSWLYGAGLLH
jgi:hypothetical protein